MTLVGISIAASSAHARAMLVDEADRRATAAFGSGGSERRALAISAQHLSYLRDARPELRQRGQRVQHVVGVRSARSST